MRARLFWVLLLAALLSAGPDAVAQDEPPSPAMDTALGQSVSIRMHDPAAAKVLNQILTDPHYWDGAWQNTYDDQHYDQIRMKEVELGFIPMIGGEGDRDVPQDVVESVIFEHFEDLPAHLDVVKRVVNLGRGHDPVVGADYADTFFYLDATFLYVVFTWRVYQKRDAQGRSILWFEKLTRDMTDVATWNRYQTTIRQTTESVDRRSIFGSTAEPAEVFGLFIVEPGKVHESRVTFVARLVFGPDTGWLTNFASQIPFFIRTAIGRTFIASVDICYEQLDQPKVAR